MERHKNIHEIKKELFITNNEEIKEGDWCICEYSDGDVSVNIYKDSSGVNKYKIILTTDQDLIKDGVQAIDDEFLEWFVKNPSCESVEVEKFTGFAEDYLIIIPKEEPKCTCKEHDPYCCQVHGSCPTCVKKEEPKQDRTCTNNCSVVCGECQIFEPKQETLEEVGMYQQELFNYLNDLGVIALQSEMQEIERIVLSMQDKKMYSEKEVIEIINSFEKLCYNYQSNKDWFPSKKNEWFEQFKNK